MSHDLATCHTVPSNLPPPAASRFSLLSLSMLFHYLSFPLVLSLSLSLARSLALFPLPLLLLSPLLCLSSLLPSSECKVSLEGALLIQEDVVWNTTWYLARLAV